MGEGEDRYGLRCRVELAAVPEELPEPIREPLSCRVVDELQ